MANLNQQILLKSIPWQGNDGFLGCMGGGPGGRINAEEAARIVKHRTV